jgi:hypothetical protein
MNEIALFNAYQMTYQDKLSHIDARPGAELISGIPEPRFERSSDPVLSNEAIQCISQKSTRSWPRTFGSLSKTMGICEDRRRRVTGSTILTAKSPYRLSTRVGLQREVPTYWPSIYQAPFRQNNPVLMSANIDGLVGSRALASLP